MTQPTTHASTQRITIDDTVDITFRGAVVTGVHSDGSIEVQTSGPSFRVHPYGVDIEVEKR
jgi:hypothetical protein